MNLWALFHNLTHSHKIYAKGESTVFICMTRGPRGTVRIMYQPNQYIDPFPIDPEQLKKVFNDEPL